MAETTGLRTKFYRSEDGTLFEEIAQIASIQPAQPEREVAEVDELDPPGDVRKKLAGLIDAGEVVVTLNFDPTNQGHLEPRTGLPGRRPDALPNQAAQRLRLDVPGHRHATSRRRSAPATWSRRR